MAKAIKFAQFGGGPTLADLIHAIQVDMSLPSDKRQQLIQQVSGMTGYASTGTPLSALMSRGLGGTIGWLISKYFGMGIMGQLLSSAAGYGIGGAINNKINKPNPYPGYRVLG